MAKSKNKARAAKAKSKSAAKKTRVKTKTKSKAKPLRAAKRAKPVARKSAVKKAPVKKPVKKAAVKVPAVGGVPGQLHAAAMKVLKDRQAEEVISVNLAGRSSMADYLIIASGRAARQIAAIADYLRDAFTKLGAKQIRVEGLPEANWVIVDAGDVIVHLFRPEVRKYYRLEDIWAGDDDDVRRAALMIE